MPKQNVVVAGAGSAGYTIAKQLSATLDAAKFDLVVVNPLPHYIHLIATARMVVSDFQNLQEQTRVPLDNIFAKGIGKLVVGKVKTISPSEKKGKGGTLTLESGEELPYAVLVLATGSKWPGPIDFSQKSEAEIASFVEESRAKIAAAEKIVVVGGGALGIELTGEIQEKWPSKKITLVHGDKKLTNPTYPDKFRLSLESKLKAKGIELVLAEFVDETSSSPDSKILTTRGGKKLDADLVLYTTGPKPNTGFMKSSLGQDALSLNGFVKVLPTLQLPSHPDIFAAGDIIDINEQKQAIKAVNHAAIVSANVVAYLDDQLLKEYKGSKEMAVVTIGSKGGAGYFDVLGGITIGNWLSAKLKSGDLFPAQAKKALGVE